jgi:hypothetical protein
MGPGEETHSIAGGCPDAEKEFPYLLSEGYRKTSEVDPDYNCIAHAAGDPSCKWWPTEDEGYFWPLPNVEDDSLAAFIAAYRTLGYTECDSPAVEPGFVKVAIYVGPDGKPKHAAVQLPDTGEWSSKLGEMQDVAHRTLKAVEDAPGNRPVYGQATQFLKRPVM